MEQNQMNKGMIGFRDSMGEIKRLMQAIVIQIED
jgi:hypothetical protein